MNAAAAEHPVSTLSKDNPLQKMMEAARNARLNAYCPYSNFRVGSAVIAADGSLYHGCNVENASYGLTVCAERVALMTAVSHGHTKFKAMAICCDVKNSYKASCGACRQFIAEFSEDLDLYLVKPEGTWTMVNFNTLLPMAFTPRSLAEERVEK